MTAPTSPFCSANLPSEQEATNIALELLQLIDGLSHATPGRKLAVEPELVHLMARLAAYRGFGAQLDRVVQRALEQGADDRAGDLGAAASDQG